MKQSKLQGDKSIFNDEYMATIENKFKNCEYAKEQITLGRMLVDTCLGKTNIILTSKSHCKISQPA